MDLQEWIDAANSSCARGKAFLAIGSDVWTRDISSEEADILHAATETGEITFTQGARRLYPVLLSAGKPIFDRQSGFDMSLQWDAFTSLCLRGVLDPGANGTYRITDAARIKGRQIRAQRICGQAQPLQNG